MTEMFSGSAKKPAHSKQTKKTVARAHAKDEAMLGKENIRILPPDDDEELESRELTPMEIRKLERSEQRQFNDAMKKILSDRVRVKFPNSSDLDGRYPIKLGLNGYQILIRRNVPVDVPRAILDMADTREIGVVTQTLNDQKDGLIDSIEEVSRFTYQVIADPAPAMAKAA